MEYTLDQAEERLRNLSDEIRRVGSKEDDKFTDEDRDYLNGLETEFDELVRFIEKKKRQALVERVDYRSGTALSSTKGDNPTDLDDDPLGEPRSINDPGVFHNPWDVTEMRTWNKTPGQLGQELRARAMSAIERMPGSNDRRREAMTNIIEKWDTPSGKLAKQLIATSSPAYLRAFEKSMKNQAHLMDNEEREAVNRAMSLTDTAGGFLVPFQLDPAVIITSDGTRNDIRAAARQVIATGDVWNGVSSAAVSWSWDAEAAEVSDDATTFAQPSITIYKAAGFVPISLEALQDEANVAQEVGRLLAFGKDTLENDAFATGTGSSQPFGIVGALNGVSGSQVAATTNNAFGLPDVYALDEDIPARYRINGSWLANRAIYNDVRQFDTAGGAALWERLGADVPPLLVGKNAYEAEGMVSSATATTNAYVLIFGDFDNYVIADRIGTSVEFIPHLFATGNNRPSGQRGWYAYYRVGADSVNDGAFRMLRA